MPERTTIVMPPALKAKAVLRARQQGLSFGEFVRKAVEVQLQTPARRAVIKLKKNKTGDPFWDNMVAYEDAGPTDFAVRHDDYLYDLQEESL